MIRGVISIGTNSTRALVAQLDGTATVLLTRSTGTRIGEGLKERGELQPEAVKRTLDAIREHAAAVHEHTEDVRAIATSALRRASDARAFADEVSALAGAPLEIISGEEEARRSFIGALSGIAASADETFGVLDTGGGSSEYAVGTKRGPAQIVSCETGAVRLTEAVPELGGTAGSVSTETLGHARALAAQALEPVREFERVSRLVFVGGSATTAIGLIQGKRDYFDYAELSREQLQQLIDLLSRSDLEARRALPGMNPQRADILLAGLLILDEVFSAAHHERALVSTNDLLLGTLLA